MSRRAIVFLAALVAGLAAFSTPAVAQRRGIGRAPGIHAYGVSGMQTRGRGRMGGSASLRLEVTPRETEVFVDGYAQGIVDQYDGIFQRLGVQPGQHELVLYLDGYRTVWQQIGVAPGSDQKIKYAMVPLAPGEVAEPRPVAQGRGRGRGTPVPPARGRGELRYGSVAIRVQPAGAEVFIDGERWQASGSDGQDRLVVQLSAGSHKIEVRKPGYQTFSTDVDVRIGETASINVSLSR